ncbi:MAG: NAD-dependent epimerase/dehydratase family protein [Thermoanaerobaculia bacterium]|nr:NAD-dependent epimerase/dehydratase family protein [Thermoanaerobaculia bacterium]
MLYLTAPARRTEASETGPHGGGAVGLLFGAGLVGRRIGAALLRRGWTCRETTTPWTDGPRLLDHLRQAERWVQQVGPCRLDVVWSAGRAGFAADEEQILGEEANFRRLLDMVVRVASSTSGQIVFHLISSAGGLFEGQRHVAAGSCPCPQRPYGVLKLRLEELLANLDFPRPISRRVYRLTSVYGPSVRGGRRGLVPTLLHNAREGRATTIVGQLTTLRDYVFTEDIARHIADAWVLPTQPDRCEILASGKPTTIHEIVHHVHKVVHRTPALVFAARRDNATDITFAPSVLPPDWAPTDLETSIFQLHRNVFDDPGLAASE